MCNKSQGFYGLNSTLSPAAQAVLDAVASQMEGGWISPDFIPYEAKKIAAALRAAADQVVPVVDEAAIGRVQNRIGTIYTCGSQDARRRIRAELLAIATELKSQ
jgi:hypothetical protein